MNVGELKKCLEWYDNNTTVIVTRNSDYATVESLEMLKLIPQDWGMMDWHDSLAPEKKALAQTYLHLSTWSSLK